MKLEFLGTGAADWHIDRRQDGEFFRRFSSTLVDGDLLIDPGPHIFDYAKMEGKPGLFNNVKYILITHSHGDHLNDANAQKIHAMTGALMYGHKTVDYRMREAGMPEILVPLTEREEYQLGEYTVIPYAANHLTPNPEGEVSYNYIIKKGDKSFFYGCDCGWIMAYAWEGMKKYKVNAIVFELTVGDVRGTDHIFYHTSIPMLECMLYSFRGMKVVGEDTKLYATHLARTLHASHEETVKRLEPLGVLPMYDGAIVEV